ncbi:hypothetical protein [Streptomyces prunicolor]
MNESPTPRGLADTASSAHSRAASPHSRSRNAHPVAVDAITDG